MADEFDYRVAPQVTDSALNALFTLAWRDHRRRSFHRLHRHSLTFLCAFRGSELVGYVNVAWDGGAHGFVLDTTVHPEYQRRGVGTELVRRAAITARRRGLEWLHVDFEPRLAPFYRNCGFTLIESGLMRIAEF